MQVKDIMTADVIALFLEDTVERCARLMMEKELSGLPVLDRQGRVAGMVTEGDLIRRAAELKIPGYLTILGGLVYLDDPIQFIGELRRAMAVHAGRLMSRDVVTVEPDDGLEKAATLMVKHRIKRLPVIDKAGRTVGIVSRCDLMRALYPLEDNSHAN
jgi:CBS-domain-containing membrane protein